MILCKLKEASRPCVKTLPERLMHKKQQKQPGSGEGLPRPKERGSLDASWQVDALQPVRAALCFCCLRLGDHKHFPCSEPEKISLVRKQS